MLETWNTLRPQIEYLTKPFPRAAIAFANAHREAVTPYLIEVLEKVAADPSLVDDVDYLLHEYALHLLASWREPRAYAAMVALGHHDDDTVERLLGDTVTETYGRCLASVCGDDLAPLKALFEDSQASHWARNAALDAMLVRVFQGDSARDELVAYLMAQGEAQAARLRDSGRDGLDVVDCIASVATDMGAAEMQTQINGWFDAGWLDQMFIDKANFEKYVVRPFETCREAAGPHLKGYVSDVEAEMAWWACFAEKPVKQKPAELLVKPPRRAEKVGRNDPCTCGSGKKYKKCCGVN